MHTLIIIEFAIGILLSLGTILLSLILHIVAKKKRITSLSYLNLFFLSFGIFKFIDSFAILYENELFARMSGVLLMLLVYFLIFWINYLIKESILSFGLLLLASLSVFHIYLAFQSESIQIITYAEYQRIGWTNLFLISIMVHRVIICCYIFYWGLKTWVSAPLETKKLAAFLFFGITFGLILFFTLSILLYVIPFLVVFKNLAMFGTLIVVGCVLIKNPKMVYVLPFIVYRLIIKDQNGHPLYDHNWSLSNINENMFSGFINAIEIMSEEIMKIGGLLDINLQNGILTLNRSNYITVGLTASKKSKLLEESVINFTIDFEQKFKRLLKKSCIDMTEYLSAQELIKKHFPNIPYRIHKELNQKYILSPKYTLLKQLDYKFKDIFGNTEEYEEIIEDLAKAPISTSNDFFNLYDDLKDEPEEFEYRSEHS
ncbi:MAG: hypothetical protein JXA99_11405 [Candidatus Lokiarchaeota archaeon]|nr:hypothetical protein [Candidatus Lokiarchaeota archaeon]